MKEDIVELPLKDWWYALMYAGRFEMENREYPGPTGKRILKILPTNTGHREFTIIFEDGSTRKFIAEDR